MMLHHFSRGQYHNNHHDEGPLVQFLINTFTMNNYQASNRVLEDGLCGGWRALGDGRASDGHQKSRKSCDRGAGATTEKR